MKSLTSMASILVLSASSVFFGVGCMAEAAESTDLDEQAITDETAELVEAADDEENTGETKEAFCGGYGLGYGLGGYGLGGYGFGGYGYGAFGGCGCGAGIGIGIGYGFGGCGVGCGVGCGIGRCGGCLW